LSNFFFQGHPLQQVNDADITWQCRNLVVNQRIPFYDVILDNILGHVMFHNRHCNLCTREKRTIILLPDRFLSGPENDGTVVRCVQYNI
jgi:hypothetical protein